MHVTHSTYEGVESETILWRYMDFTKFVSLVSSQALFFAKPDMFDDPFEGEFADANKAEVDEDIHQKLPDVMLKSVEDSTGISPDSFRRSMRDKVIAGQKSDVAINCWHINPYESAAMWKLYSKSNDGIAVQSTYGRLSDCFRNTTLNVYIGRVNYINYANDKMETPFDSFLYKRKSFEYENELRAVIYWRRAYQNQEVQVEHYSGGVYIPVDLHTLVQKVYIAPNAPLWLADLTHTLLKQFNLGEIILQQSQLYSKSMF